MKEQSLLEKLRALPRKKKNILMVVLLIISGLLILGVLDLTFSTEMQSLSTDNGEENAQAILKENSPPDQTEVLSPVQGLFDNFKGLKDFGVEKTAKINLGNKITSALQGIFQKINSIWKNK